MSERKQPAVPCGDAAPQSSRERWLEENRAAMDAWNAYVEAHGLPLAAFRQFGGGEEG